MVQKMDDIERDLDICAELFDLIDLYDIPGNDEDLSGFQVMFLKLKGFIYLVLRF